MVQCWVGGLLNGSEGVRGAGLARAVQSSAWLLAREARRRGGRSFARRLSGSFFAMRYPPPPLALTQACPNTETPCFRTFGPFFEPSFLRF